MVTKIIISHEAKMASGFKASKHRATHCYSVVILKGTAK
jgi:hypothetical protein